MQIQATGPTMSCLSQAVRIVRAQKKSEKNEKWSLVDAKNVISKFQKIAKYSDTPHPAWMLCAPLIQVRTVYLHLSPHGLILYLQIPAFLTCVIGIRRMCQQQWPGFTEGGILWFSDLTQSTVQFSEMTTQMGPIGAALPLAISVSYLLHIQLSFRKGHIAASATPPSSFFPYPFPVASILASTGQALSRLLKLGFEWLCVPILVVTLQLPQGALVYWLTSSLCSVTQSVLLGNSAVRRSLRLSKLQETSHHDILSRFTPQVMDLFIRAAEQRAKGSYEEAIGTLQRIVQVDPNNPRAHYALGQLLGEQQRWEDAASCYRSCLTYESDPQLLSKGFLGLGVAEFMKSDFESSERSLISSLKLDRSNVAGWMALCSLYKRMGDSDRAKAALQHAIDLDPNCKQWEKHL